MSYRCLPQGQIAFRAVRAAIIWATPSIKEINAPIVRAAVEAMKPILLLRQDSRGRWAWKRTGKGGWHVNFATEADACADAEHCGIPKPYVIERDPSPDSQETTK